MSHFLKSVSIYFRSSPSNLLKNTDDKLLPMQLAPSDIHFLSDYNQQSYKPDQNLLISLVNRASAFNFVMSKSNKHHESKLNNNNNEYQMNRLMPKIQVAECKGAWFALNNSHLHVFRELERQGKCAQIQVDVVPLSKVPLFVQKSMIVQLPSKPDLITWDQDENETEEDENGPLLVRNAVLGEKSLGEENVNEFQTLKKDLKNSFRNVNNAESCCNWVEQFKQIEQDCGKKEEQSMVELEPVLFTHQGSGKVNKQGYHQLNDGGAGSSPENSVLPYKTTFLADSEIEGIRTDFSDYDLEGAEDSDSEYDESLTCNVCDRCFSCEEKLIQHQQRKRHYGCSVCDSIFPNLMTLELHKESLEHWSDGEDAGFRDVCEEEDDDDDDDDEEEDDDEEWESQAEELERLL